ncbi:hypothetical protein FA13DRAFT_1792094 [Coprinellus micaceus]|uniref:Fungal-type protein kinase domain-containing protein n=1 Tax=Coprinellus micaceus TaxID=71717 RepID=A0A4Y7SQP9_COPMI|nr:hypothetical protein FA13DRAFT_1797421 [Coprinellus micaceus]TEB30527.1 hypothetical protein FA13DRAFT_1792094 [Coprinellus micaceus]
MAETQDSRKTPSPTPGTKISSQTPRSARLTTGSQSAPQAREYVAIEMRHDVVRCSLNNWFGAYQTFEPSSEEVAACVRALAANPGARKGNGQKKLTRGPLIKDGRFVPFKVSPSQNQETENDVFKPFKAIAERLCTVDLDTASKTTAEAKTDGPPATGEVVASNSTDTGRAIRRHSSAQWNYDSRPNRAIPGEQDGSTNRVDGYFHRRFTEHDLSLGDVAAICEYKKKREDANRLQLVGAASHLLNQDPVRFAVYGVTIEDCDVSLWYFCRSHTAKSEPFNFLENPAILVKVFLSFMFAHSESLGFDSNIRRIMPFPGEARSISYVYRFAAEDNGKEREHYYRTRRTICDAHRLCITGRATRVWEAEQVRSFDDLTTMDEEVVVLREVWLDEGAATERQIQQAIFASLDQFGAQLKEDPSYSPPHFVDFDDDLKKEVWELFEEDHTLPPCISRTRGHRKAYEKHFLTIVEDFLGQPARAIAKNYQVDSMLLRKVQHIRTAKSSTVRGADSSRNNQNSATALQPRSPGPAQDSIPAREYRQKRPYRLIYKERCLDLDDEAVTSLEDIFIGLRGCFTALVLLFCAGWVHRDISCGNVLIWTDGDGNKHGKLGDLEYAKRYPSMGGSPDPKTGTAYFMPVEIMLGYRLILRDTSQKKRRIEPLTARQRLQAARSRPQTDNADLLPREEPDPLQHHFLHELECLWWLTLWSITCKLGNWNHVKNVFVPFMTENIAIVRKSFFADQVSFHFAALGAELPQFLQPAYLHLQTARDYFSTRLFELAALSTTERENPAEYSLAYAALRDLVKVEIPSNSPPVVRGSNPFWEVVSEGEPKALEPETSSKHPRSDS